MGINVDVLFIGYLGVVWPNSFHTEIKTNKLTHSFTNTHKKVIIPKVVAKYSLVFGIELFFFHWLPDR